MRIVLTPYGSLGDTRPIVALGVGLQAAGHEVLLSGPPEQEDLARRHSIPFHPLGTNLQEFATDFPEPAKHVWKATIGLIHFLRQEARTQIRALPDLIRDADLVMAASLNLGAASAAEVQGIPYRFIAFCPQLLPSRTYPSLMQKSHDRPFWWNRLTWRFNDYFWNSQLGAVINEERENAGLRRIPHILPYWFGEHVMVASDAALGVVPEDVSYLYTQVGHLELEEREAPDPALLAFLDSGPPPVYAGFGSMIHEDPDRTSRILLDAVRSTGLRLVLASGWAGIQAQESKDCYVLDHAPHRFLFSAVEAVIHHGGSGTTATAARAGVPQIIVPHMSDQYYWGTRIFRAGLGPRPLWRSRINAGRLAAALRECIGNNQMKENAHAVAETLHREDPVRKAVDWVESQVA